MRATLVFILRDAPDDGAQEVLLIRKKRGIGAGKINGPGGKIDPGETPMQCAIRETQEELHVTAVDPKERGRLRFQFTDGLSIHCVVFIATHHTGTATETEEAVPLWTPVDAIPYDEMWEDDREWLPHALRGQSFEGDFIFDGDSMVSKRIVWGTTSAVPESGGSTLQIGHSRSS
ncbi:MAG: 8-oxo-dGTP diphosphatase [Verrucomicrobia bacterium]|nr:8-oxo-dGTP diphosphatase [Verrucomicrobiota bacterium]